MNNEQNNKIKWWTKLKRIVSRRKASTEDKGSVFDNDSLVYVFRFNKERILKLSLISYREVNINEVFFVDLRKFHCRMFVREALYNKLVDEKVLNADEMLKHKFTGYAIQKYFESLESSEILGMGRFQ